MQVVEPHRNTSTTVKTPREILARMGETVRANAYDVAEWASLPLDRFFDLVRGGTYNREPTSWNSQVLARPRDSISKAVPVIACANKAIILAAWAQMNRIPWRLVAVGNHRGYPPHHVFPEFYVAGQWRAVDATYPWSVLFAAKNYPVRVVYHPPQSSTWSTGEDQQPGRAA